MTVVFFGIQETAYMTLKDVKRLIHQYDYYQIDYQDGRTEKYKCDLYLIDQIHSKTNLEAKKEEAKDDEC